MQARIGDQVVIEGHRVGTTPRCGEVLDVAGSLLTVRWDDGHDSVFVPGPDCRIVRAEGSDIDDVDRFGASIELRVVEDGSHCEAVATLMAQRGTFEGRGSSHRHPDDPNVPLIGEELAIGRALRALSDELLDEASRTDARAEMTPTHLLHR